MAFTRTTTVNAAPGGDTTRQAVLDLDTDLTNSFTHLNTLDTDKAPKNSPTLTTPNIGAATATSINGTTIPTSKTLVVTTDKLSALAATTSAELAGVISDETGSGALVFANSPTLVTPTLGTATATSINGTSIPSSQTLLYSGGALGTPASGTVTNLTGTASININGTVGATTPSTGVFTTINGLGISQSGAASSIVATDSNRNVIIGSALATGGSNPTYATTGVTVCKIGSNPEVVFANASASAGYRLMDILMDSSASMVFRRVGEDWGSATTLMTLDASGNLTISGSTATKASGTTWANPSDERLKTDIQDYTRGLDDVLKIRPVTGEYNGKGGTPEGVKFVSIIAQEMLLIAPETITTFDAKLEQDDEETTELLKFDGGSDVIWMLVNAVKELSTRLAALESK